MNGSIKLFIGPMFAAKSSHMSDEVEKNHIANRACIVVRHSSDKRYMTSSGGIITHAGREYSKLLTIEAAYLREVYEEISQYDVIGIDEVQFFDDCVGVIQDLANHGKTVICAGLDGDFMARPFTRVSELIPLAEDVIKLKAVCMNCCAPASFTKKHGDGPLFDVGGIGKYSAFCRACMWPK